MMTWCDDGLRGGGYRRGHWEDHGRMGGEVAADGEENVHGGTEHKSEFAEGHLVRSSFQSSCSRTVHFIVDIVYSIQYKALYTYQERSVVY
jgi:hypothetical protein